MRWKGMALVALAACEDVGEIDIGETDSREADPICAAVLDYAADNEDALVDEVNTGHFDAEARDWWCEDSLSRDGEGTATLGVTLRINGDGPDGFTDDRAMVCHVSEFDQGWVVDYCRNADD